MAETQGPEESGVVAKPLRTVEDLCERIRSYYPQADISVVEKAYRFSEKAHEGQFRRSGEAYISHPLNVAGILADLHLDLDSIVTAILHDTVEDTHATLDDIRREFGDTVALLVDGVTKISQMKFKNSLDKQGENIRKMIVAMGKDVRVVLVKLADRLHNMRTLGYMPYEKQARIAQETLEIYAPLAGRIGINQVKIELEDLCFRYYRPDQYYELVQKVKKTEAERQRYIENVKREIIEALGKNSKCEIYGRAKHLWSIYKKMTSRNIDYEQVYDILAFRVIVPDIPECYAALGHIHSLWKPVPGRFKDFIAMPKANNYQSLHTTVMGPDGERIEIQIRTQDMHEIAEKGIAAHWRYKERGSKITDDTTQQANWLRELVQWHQQMGNPGEFLETVKNEFVDSEIYVFTPNGDVKEFPDGSTPVDFAYAVHTQLGNTIVGARVNGRMVPLKYQLKNGDTVEVVTAKTQTPSKDWLKFVVTSRAKNKIRQFVAEEQRRRSLILGKDLLEKEFRKFGAAAVRFLKGETFERFLKDNGTHSLDDLYIKVGYGKLEPRTVVDNLMPQDGAGTVETDKPSFMEKIVRSAAQKPRTARGLVSVDGMDDVLVHYAKCCHPIPGDPIVGFISRGRGVMIHRADCPRAFEMDQMRKVDVQWNVKQAGDGLERMVKLKILSQDTPGLLKAMSEAFATQGINIQSAQIRTTKDKKAVCHFEISVRDSTQLNNAILELQKIKGVIGVSRVMN
ncbi:MAG: bifunctional (p)ppGpp synthetase/guanosine-3',5'-bis(diphosphate) 3'-pyrophosphohydrolase [Bdellovibrionaceae bacterium]|nr:bifunctional (p)ppGpp synthetase/guanosine-3',5'-bis(diphosphate) 3'-pyrophosphohydrolase [Pseudobdellovibrionaceae bacterium]